jgi:hypothetical protein
MNVSELEGSLLDYWVAKAAGYTVRYYPQIAEYEVGEGMYSHGHIGMLSQPVLDSRRRFSPSNDWVTGGPIIECEGIAIVRFDDGWYAFHPQNCDGYGGGYIDVNDWANGGIQGHTPLIAAMRAYVASRFGDTVPDS